MAASFRKFLSLFFLIGCGGGVDLAAPHEPREMAPDAGGMRSEIPPVEMPPAEMPPAEMPAEQPAMLAGPPPHSCDAEPARRAAMDPLDCRTIDADQLFEQIRSDTVLLLNHVEEAGNRWGDSPFAEHWISVLSGPDDAELVPMPIEEEPKLNPEGEAEPAEAPAPVDDPAVEGDPNPEGEAEPAEAPAPVDDPAVEGDPDAAEGDAFDTILEELDRILVADNILAQSGCSVLVDASSDEPDSEPVALSIWSPAEGETYLDVLIGTDRIHAGAIRLGSDSVSVILQDNELIPILDFVFDGGEDPEAEETNELQIDGMLEVTLAHAEIGAGGLELTANLVEDFHLRINESWPLVGPEESYASLELERDCPLFRGSLGPLSAEVEFGVKNSVASLPAGFVAEILGATCDEGSCSSIPGRVEARAPDFRVEIAAELAARELELSLPSLAQDTFGWALPPLELVSVEGEEEVTLASITYSSGSFDAIEVDVDNAENTQVILKFESATSISVALDWNQAEAQFGTPLGVGNQADSIGFAVQPNPAGSMVLIITDSVEVLGGRLFLSSALLSTVHTVQDGQCLNIPDAEPAPAGDDDLEEQAHFFDRIVIGACE